jgi:hypothetical protein
LLAEIGGELSKGQQDANSTKKALEEAKRSGSDAKGENQNLVSDLAGKLRATAELHAKLEKSEELVQELEKYIQEIENSSNSLELEKLRKENKEISQEAQYILRERDDFNYQNKVLKDEKAALLVDFKATMDTLDKLQHSYNKLLATHAVTMFELDRRFMLEHGDNHKYNRLFDFIIGGNSVNSPTRSPLRRRARREGEESDPNSYSARGRGDKNAEKQGGFSALVPGLKLTPNAMQGKGVHFNGKESKTDIAGSLTDKSADEGLASYASGRKKREKKK